AESNVTVKITIKEGDKTHSYLNEIPVVRDVRSDENFRPLGMEFVERPLPLGAVREGEIISFLTTVDAYGPSTKHEFFMKRTLKEEKRIDITLLRREGDTFKQAPKNIIIENALNLVNLIRVDLDL